MSDGTRTVWKWASASETDAKAPELWMYPRSEPGPGPKRGSYGESAGLTPGDLITPDGVRVWMIAGWVGGSVRCWPLYDLIKEYHAGKQILDRPECYAPLNQLNLSRREDPDLCAGIVYDLATSSVDVIGSTEQYWESWWPETMVGRKIFALGAASPEHIVVGASDDSLVVRSRCNEVFEVDLREVTSTWRTFTDSPSSTLVIQNRVAKTVSGQYLYRLFNRAGLLLYVGISDNPLRRWNEHSKSKDWWPEVANLSQDWYPDRTSVELAERHAIKVERPKYNVTHNRGA